ncbi:uncharacterized protein LOC135370624 isoform X2 [Ornithodoros turicata]|uniref:uncharacterized protein LOC135370624 isoform X2 n=1 Tax=Ornithodoros turicata TaxID=34597 RepID=UPI003139E5DA
MKRGSMEVIGDPKRTELAPDGVRVNAVNPVVIVTDVHKRGGMSEDDYAKFLEHSKTTHALGRVGQVHSVSRLGRCLLYHGPDVSSGRWTQRYVSTMRMQVWKQRRLNVSTFGRLAKTCKQTAELARLSAVHIYSLDAVFIMTVLQILTQCKNKPTVH